MKTTREEEEEKKRNIINKLLHGKTNENKVSRALKTINRENVYVRFLKEEKRKEEKKKRILVAGGEGGEVRF